MPNRSPVASAPATGLFPSLEPASGASSPKSSGWISAHCDGGARGNPGPAGYGALIEDASGVVLAELSEFLGFRTNNFAEYSGLLGCLQWALDHGHRRLRVVSDSELMVKQIQGKYQVKSPDLKPLYDEAKRRIAKLEKFEISHALRHKNKDADRLANEAMDLGMKDRGMKKPGATPQAAATSQKANPYPAKATSPPVPIAFAKCPAPPPVAKADAMLRGFTRDGVVHVLGGEKLPDGIFVKIIRE
jgi:probable phosphoglycerate mutase